MRFNILDRLFKPQTTPESGISFISQQVRYWEQGNSKTSHRRFSLPNPLSPDNCKKLREQLPEGYCATFVGNHIDISRT